MALMSILSHNIEKFFHISRTCELEIVQSGGVSNVFYAIIQTVLWTPIKIIDISLNFMLFIKSKSSLK